MAKSMTWVGLFNPREAKMVGVREALSWLKERHADNMIVEMDAQLVCYGIQGSGGVRVFENLIWSMM